MSDDMILTFQINSTQIKHINYTHHEPKYIMLRHKEYILALQRVKSKTDSSLYTECCQMLIFFKFLNEFDIKELTTYSYLDNQKLLAYLKTSITKRGKPLAQSSQRLVYTFFKSFSIWLFNNYPNEAPNINIFIGKPFINNNATIKTDYFSDDILKKIKDGIKNETNIQTKAYISLLYHYGLRSGDITNLTIECIKMSDKDGKYDLHYFDHKAKEDVVIPAILPHVSATLSKLIHYTHEYRKETKTKYIFFDISKSKARLMNSYQKARLNKFVKEHNVTNNGSNIKITAHMFRRTLATNMQSDGVTLEATQSILNHKNKRTTFNHYVKTKENDYIEQITKVLDNMIIIKNISNLQDSNLPAKNIRLADGYCTNENMIVDNNYICDIYKKRANCYGCDKMVTTPKFIPYFKKLIKQKEDELDTNGIYGLHVTRQIEFEIELAQALVEKLTLLQESI